MVSSILRRARDNMIGPVLIHLVTRKARATVLPSEIIAFPWYRPL
jgi:hypothetical protein